MEENAKNERKLEIKNCVTHCDKVIIMACEQCFKLFCTICMESVKYEGIIFYFLDIS